MKASRWQRFRAEHPDLTEFILFNILSNCATIVNFAVMWLGTNFLFRSFEEIPFRFLFFNYADHIESNRGLCGFLSFLAANAAAQAVNFVVQKKFVFHSDASFRRAAPKYAALACFLVILSAALPAYSQTFFENVGMSHAAAPWAAQLLNILLQVGISYPALRFWIMPKS